MSYANPKNLKTQLEISKYKRLLKQKAGANLNKRFFVAPLPKEVQDAWDIEEQQIYQDDLRMYETLLSMGFKPYRSKHIIGRVLQCDWTKDALDAWDKYLKENDNDTRTT